MLSKGAIVFNALKHHLASIQYYIEKTKKSNAFNLLMKDLLVIGESQMDLYYGNMDEDQIREETIAFLKTQAVSDLLSFRRLLEKHDDFISYRLSDGSLWILRMGVDENRFLHIHPGRHSIHTIRVKALTLKTAIAALTITETPGQTPDIQIINKARTEVLNLPPVKGIATAQGIEKIMTLIQSGKI